MSNKGYSDSDTDEIVTRINELSDEVSCLQRSICKLRPDLKSIVYDQLSIFFKDFKAWKREKRFQND
jgi:hypothetical protein